MAEVDGSVRQGHEADGGVVGRAGDAHGRGRKHGIAQPRAGDGHRGERQRGAAGLHTDGGRRAQGSRQRRARSARRDRRRDRAGRDHVGGLRSDPGGGERLAVVRAGGLIGHSHADDLEVLVGGSREAQTDFTNIYRGRNRGSGKFVGRPRNLNRERSQGRAAGLRHKGNTGSIRHDSSLSGTNEREANHSGLRGGDAGQSSGTRHNHLPGQGTRNRGIQTIRTNCGIIRDQRITRGKVDAYVRILKHDVADLWRCQHAGRIRQVDRTTGADQIKTAARASRVKLCAILINPIRDWRRQGKVAKAGRDTSYGDDFPLLGLAPERIGPINQRGRRLEIKRQASRTGKSQVTTDSDVVEDRGSGLLIRVISKLPLDTRASRIGEVA